MKDFIIKSNWKLEVYINVFLIICFVLFAFYAPDSKWSFAYKPLIVMLIIVCFFSFRHRKKQIVLNEEGVKFSDGTLCKWNNILLIEQLPTGSQESSLVVHTKNHIFKESLFSYKFNYSKMKVFVHSVHPEIPVHTYYKKIGKIFYARKKEWVD